MYTYLVSDIVLLNRVIEEVNRSDKVESTRSLLNLSTMPNPYQETPRFDEKLPNGGVTYTDGKGIEHFRGTNFRSLHGAILYDRYDLHHVIGMGTFAVVYRITDRAHENRQMAMKIEPVSSQTARQLAVIARLKNSPFTDEKFYIAQHYESFNIIISKVNHLCTVMDQYGCNVHQFLEDNKEGLPVTLCFIMLKQVLEGFSYLHEVACISHLDFKPENVVFLSWRRQDLKQGFDITEVPTIRIIDFNSATLQLQTYGRTACTIHYRPPETCLKLGANRLADIWSVGCFAYFIHTRRTLFCNYTNIGVLLQHERTLDATPQHILMRARRAGSHLIRPFVWGGRLRLFLSENLNAESLINSRPLRQHYNRNDFREIAYYALMRAMLEQDVDQRPTASQLLAMPIFNLPIIFQNNRRRPFFRRVHSLPTALIGRSYTSDAQF